MKTILCPTDFSVNAANAVEYAAQFCSQFNSRLIILHVYEGPMTYSEIPLTVIKNADEEIMFAAQKKLNTLKSKVAKINKSLSVETVLIEGSSDTMIVEHANHSKADLIIMGTTGQSKLARLLIGSTTSYIMHHANCPVLCIPKESAFKPIRKIVYATDLHEDNISAAMRITGLARLFEAEIVFVFVDDKHLIHDEKKIEEMSAKIRKRVKYPHISGYICNNANVSKGLEYFIKKNKSDLLVMFTHKHHNGLLFNQSITKMVSHQTRIPLLALNVSDLKIINME